MKKFLQASLALSILLVAFTYVWAATTDKNYRMARDNNGQVMQQPTHLKFQDATGTPKVSGGVTDQTATTLTVPTGATYCCLQADQSIKVGDNSTLDGSGSNKGYRTVSANTQFNYPCANASSIYIKKVSSNYALEFHFEMVRAQD